MTIRIAVTVYLLCLPIFPVSPKVVRCPKPAAPKNGQFTPQKKSYSIDEEVRFSCQYGFILRDNLRLQKCLDDGSWSAWSPTCKYVQCEYLDEPDHGRLLKGDGYPNVDSFVQYKCYDGFAVFGRSRITCSRDGEWSIHRIPVCESSACTQTPGDPYNGKVKLTGTRHDDEATYTCNAGYSLIGVKKRRCNMRRWTSNPPTCRKDTCLVPTVANGTLLQSNHPWFGRAKYGPVKDDHVIDNSSLFVHCNAGFVLKPKQRNDTKRIEIICRNGRWADVPSCQRPNCMQIPRTQSHGKVNVTGNRHGDNATYTCDAGYSLRGVSKIRCYIGRWSSSPPKCTENYCPSVILNNRRIKVISGEAVYRQSGDEYKHKSLIEILCKSGYEVSEMSLTKEEKWSCFNSTWTKTDSIACETCRVPTVVNGNVLEYVDPWYEGARYEEVKTRNVKEGSSLFVNCTYGYVLQPNPLNQKTKLEITCRNGKWADVPSCQRPSCTGTPRHPFNGRVNLTGKRHGDEATYTCDVGYSLKGVWKRKCRHGRWLSSPPTCTETGCWMNISHSRYEAIADSKNVYGPGESVKLYCLSLLFVVKNNVSEATCRKGKWDPSRPTCIPEPCRAHNPIERGQIEYSSEADGDFINHGDVATVRCDEGYQIDGPQNQTCRYRNWQPKEKPLKSCVPASCVFTSFEGDNETVSHEESREVSCPPGFHVSQDHEEGTFVRTVVASCHHGEWLPISPECQPDGCLLPRLPDAQFCLSNGTCRAQVIISDGTRVSVECRDGFTWEDPSINNTVSLNCSLGDLQADNYSNCITEGLGCSDPGTADNSNQTASWPIHGANLSLGDTLTYSCHPGYLIDMFEESQEIKCLENGQWSQEKPVCTAVRCDKPTAPRKGTFQPVKEDYWVNDTVRFHCDGRYFLEGNENMTCRADGTWSRWEPKCTYDKGCGILYEPPHGRLVKGTRYTKPGSVVEYTCFAGFVIRGPNKMTCLSTRKWDYDIPVCEAAVDCNDVPEVYNAVIIAGRKTNYIEGNTVKYQCKEDFIEAAGADMNVTCNLNGTWNTSKVICKGGKCTAPNINNPNLRVTYVNEVGQRLSVTPFDDVMPGTNMLSRCTDFYGERFEGSFRRVCDRGEWTGQEPKCHKNLKNDGNAPNSNYYVIKDIRSRPTGTATILDDGELEVTAGTSLYLRCNTVLPLKWQLPSSQSDCKSTNRCRMTSHGFPGFFVFSLFLKSMDDSHTGKYSCFSSDRSHYRRDFRIKVV